jgi:hypothetical protein
MPKPVRLQLSRKKVARLVSPNGLPIKVVSRPSRFSNPYLLDRYEIVDAKGRPVSKKETKKRQRIAAVRDFEHAINIGAGWVPSIEEIQRELRRCNLACWCPLDEPCHADVLLRIANE